MAWPTLIGFEEQKAAQISAFLAAKEKAGLDKMKLIKLVYLAEREFVSRHGHPMLFDELYSLEHGPICSSCLNGMNFQLDEKLWRRFISKADNKISAVAAFKREELDHLSEAEIGVLDAVWEKFGHMTAAELRKYTHDHCPEYTEVQTGTRLEISYRDLFGALGFDSPQECEDRVADIRRAHNSLSY